MILHFALVKFKVILVIKKEKIYTDTFFNFSCYSRYSEYGWVKFGRWTLFPTNLYVNRAKVVPLRYGYIDTAKLVYKKYLNLSFGGGKNEIRLK